MFDYIKMTVTRFDYEYKYNKYKKRYFKLTGSSNQETPNLAALIPDELQPYEFVEFLAPVLEYACKGNLSLHTLQRFQFFYGTKPPSQTLLCQALTELLQPNLLGDTMKVRRTRDGVLITSYTNQIFELFRDTVPNPEYTQRYESLKQQLTALYSEVGYPPTEKYRIIQRLVAQFTSTRGRDPTRDERDSLYQSYLATQRNVHHDTLVEIRQEYQPADDVPLDLPSLVINLTRKRRNLYQVTDNQGNLLYPREIPVDSEIIQQRQPRRDRYNQRVIDSINEVMSRIATQPGGSEFVDGFYRGVPSLGEEGGWRPQGVANSPRELAEQEIQLNLGSGLRQGEPGYVTMGTSSVYPSGKIPFTTDGASVTVREEVDWWINRFLDTSQGEYPNQSERDWLYQEYQPDDTLPCFS